MGIRVPALAGTFYPDRSAECLAELHAVQSELPELARHDGCVGGVVPHAGWQYSGGTALRTWTCLARAQPRPERLVVLGAVHVPGVHAPSLGSWEQWATPFGMCAVDTEFAGRLVRAGLARVHDAAHREEHAIEVSVPMIQQVLPGVRIVPVAVPPAESACGFGRALAELLAADPAVTCVVASTDLTHYGAHYYDFAPAGTGAAALRWADANDQRLLARVVGLDAEAIVAEVRRHRNACGAGALAAAVACARGLGATRAEILEHTTSHARRPEGPATDFVGYASVVFRR